MRQQFDTKRKLASVALVAGVVIYIAFSMERFYSDWATLVAGLFAPSVSGLALLITLAKYVIVGGEPGTYFKGAIVTVAIIFGIGIIMGWIGII
jgi:hypothetical protein